jgi:putative ABC transport system permease protein
MKMRNILRLSAANIRKNKGQTASLLIFVIIAALILNLGFLLYFSYGESYDKQAKEANVPDFVALQNMNFADDSQVSFIENFKGVTAVQSEDVLAENTDIDFNGGSLPYNLVMIRDADAEQIYNVMETTDGAKALGDNDIYLPFLFKVGGGLNIGDTYAFKFGGKTQTFTIAGFTYEYMFGAATSAWYQFYVNDATYKNLAADAPSSLSILRSAEVSSEKQATRLMLDYQKKYRNESPDLYSGEPYIIASDYASMKYNRTFLSDMLAMILVSFSLIIAVICLIVIRFRVRNSIEEGMTNIGTMKAMGFTTSQIAGSIIIQFCGVTLVGAIAGIGLAYAALPMVSGALEAQSAFIWKQPFDAYSSSAALLILLIAVLAVTSFASSKIRKIAPLTALRNGLTIHNFKRNSFPLEKSKAPLPQVLAAKSAIQSKGQMVMVFIIIAAISFASTAVLSTYYNIGMHSEEFARMLGGEMPDAAFFMDGNDSAKKIKSDIANDDGVRKVIYYEAVPALVEGDSTSIITTDDFADLEGTVLYEGRYPKHDNEVALSSKHSKILQKTIGDEVTLSMAGKDDRFIVTGLLQSVNEEGLVTAATLGTLENLSSTYKPTQLYVYMDDPSDAKTLIAKEESLFGANIISAVNLADLADTQLSVYSDIMFLVAIVIVAVALFVITLVLYLVLKTVILRRRRALGIQKALGFTTGQLMLQIALTYMPTISVAVITGTVLGDIGFVPFVTALFRSIGIMKVFMQASIVMSAGLCVGLIVAAFAIAMLISMRIRKISTYALVTE